VVGVDLVARVQAATAQARELAAAVRLPNRNYRYRMAQVTPLQLARAGRAQLAVALARRGQTLFLVPSLRLVVVTEQMAFRAAVDRAAAQSQARLAAEQLDKAKMEARATTTARVMLLAVEEVVLVQLV